MALRQDRYVQVDTKQRARVDIIENNVLPENPPLYREDVQQRLTNSTLPISSRAVAIALENAEIVGNFATEDYVDEAINSIDMSQYALKSSLKLKADKKYVDESVKGLATEQYVKDEIEKASTEGIDLTDYRKIDDNKFMGLLQVLCQDNSIGTGIYFFDNDGRNIRANIIVNNAGLQFNNILDGVNTSVIMPNDGGIGTLATREWAEEYIAKLEARIKELENGRV